MKTRIMYFLSFLAAAAFAFTIDLKQLSSYNVSAKADGQPKQTGSAPPQPIPAVTVGTVGEAADVETRRYTGQVVSSSSVNLTPRVSGEILNVAFREGGYVDKGDLLYELDPVRCTAAVRNAEAKAAECRAKLAYAENSYVRINNLYEQKAASKDSMESQKSELDAAHALLLAAEAALVTAQDDLANTRITAPISGKIGMTNFTCGNYVTPSSGVLTTIVQTDPLRVAFAISNRDFLSMFGNEKTLKDKASVRLRIADDSLYAMTGAVEIVANQADQRTDTIQVYARFGNADGVLLPGGTVTVLLSKNNGSTLPAVLPSAVMHDAKASYVYVLNEQNAVERREIVLGPSDERLQLVRSGLAPGEKVVVDGMHKAMSGDFVKPVLRG